MSPELRVRLTPRQVQAAERREGFPHPLLDVLGQHAPRIAEINVTYDRFAIDSPEDNQTPQKFIKKNFGFLADAVEEVRAFSLSPLELVAVWSRATEVLRGYQRYAFSEMVASAYSIQGAANPGWKGFPRYFFERDRIPTDLARDYADVTHVRGRLEDVYNHVRALDRFVHGGSSQRHLVDLAKRMSKGDKKAEVLFDRLAAISERRQSRVIGEVHENFGNGMGPLRFALNDAVETARYRLLSRDELLAEVRKVPQHVSQPEQRRQSIQANLRAYPTGIDGRRNAPWARANIYFHGIQDLMLSVASHELDMRSGQIKGSQACFVKDLDLYLAGFPEGEAEMREVFQTLLDSGSTFYWENNPIGTRMLYELFDTLDKKVIQPWKQEEEKLKTGENISGLEI